MRLTVLRVSLCALALFVAGCSSIGLESKKIDYKSASKSNVPTLEVPPDLTSPTRDNRFAVPDSGGKGSATYSQYAGERTLAKDQQQSDTVHWMPPVRDGGIASIHPPSDRVVNSLG